MGIFKKKVFHRLSRKVKRESDASAKELFLFAQVSRLTFVRGQEVLGECWGSPSNANNCISNSKLISFSLFLAKKEKAERFLCIDKIIKRGKWWPWEDTRIAWQGPIKRRDFSANVAVCLVLGQIISVNQLCVSYIYYTIYFVCVCVLDEGIFRATFA